MFRDAEKIEATVLLAMRERTGNVDTLSVRITSDRHSGVFINGAVAKPMMVNKATGISVDALTHIAPMLDFADPKRAVVTDVRGWTANRKYPVKPGDRISVPVKTQIPTFTITGGVKSLGGYDLTENLTLEGAIALAGGIGPNGDPDRIFIDRVVPIGPLSLQRDRLMLIRPGDMIRLGLKSEAPLVTVSGLVKEPKNLEWRSDLTVLRVLTEAGGVLDPRCVVRVKSKINTKKKEVKFRISDVASGKFKDFLLEPGDVVDVAIK